MNSLIALVLLALPFIAIGAVIALLIVIIGKASAR